LRSVETGAAAGFSLQPHTITSKSATLRTAAT
jgi:hypothetical protein